METYEQYIKRTGDTIPKSLWETKQLNLNRKTNLSPTENKTLGKYQEQTNTVKHGSRQDKINKGFMTENGIATGKTEIADSPLDVAVGGGFAGAAKLGVALTRPIFIKAAKPVTNILAKQLGTKVNPVKGAYKFIDETIDSSGKVFKSGDVVEELSEEIKVSPLKYLMNKNKIKTALNQAGDESAIVTTNNPMFKRTGERVEGNLVDLAKKFGGASQKQGEMAHSYTGVNMGELKPSLANIFANVGKRNQHSAALHFRKEGGSLPITRKLKFQIGGLTTESLTEDQKAQIINEYKRLGYEAHQLYKRKQFDAAMRMGQTQEKYARENDPDYKFLPAGGETPGHRASPSGISHFYFNDYKPGVATDKRVVYEKNMHDTGYDVYNEVVDDKGVVKKIRRGTSTSSKPNTEFKKIIGNKSGGLLKFQNGGLNIIPKGVLHKNKNNIPKELGFGGKGIPVVYCNTDGNCEKTAEIESNELILTKDNSTQLDRLITKHKNGAASLGDIGSFFKQQLMSNTHNNTKGFKSIRNGKTKIQK